MPESLSNHGHALIKKETTKGVAVIPDFTIPLIGESMTTDPHAAETKLIVGHGFARHANYMGQRSHMGDLTLLAEPNSAGYLLDMNLTKSNTSGSGPYTHTFIKSATANPNAYTVQIQRGDIPFRYYGVEGRGLQLGFQDGVGQFTAPITARGCFSVASITNVATTTLTLDSTYHTSPTTGLVNGDLVRIWRTNGTTLDTTISSITNGTTVVVASATTVAIGDTITLRALTPALNLTEPILWARSEYRFSETDAAAALSATHTPIEADSGAWNLISALQTDEGEGRSGSYDRASLARTIADFELSIRQVFEGTLVERSYLLFKKKAVAIRHFCGTNHEIRATLNHTKVISKPNPLTVDNVIYDELTLRPQYDATDGTAFSTTVINGIATI